MICKLCQKEYSNNTGLHGHIKRVHSLNQVDYYHYFYPNYDLYSKDLIIYKNYDQYFTSKFNNRDNFINWALNNSNVDEVKKYCIDFLRERKERKNIEYLPSQVEAKSLFFPSYFGLSKFFNGIDNFLQSVDFLKSRFDYSTQIKIKNGTVQTIVDTREQRPLAFTPASKVMKLSVGDYTAEGEFYSDVFVERKSLEDLCGTLSMNQERFENEIQKAEMLGLYLVVVIDCPYQDAVNYSPQNSFSKKTSGARIFHIIRDLMSKYMNIQFVFSGSRSNSQELIEKIFRLGSQVRLLDLEFLKDGGILNVA